MDGLRDRFTYVRSQLLTTVPFEWFIALLVVFVCLSSLGVGDKFSGAPEWVVFAAWTFAPYVLFQCLRLVWQPVPFFNPQPVARVVLPAGEYGALCFGTFEHPYSARSFWRGRPLARKARITFGWCRGTVVLSPGRAFIHARAQTVAYRAAFEGNITRDLEASAPDAANVRRGEATVLWQRLPALELTGPDYKVIAILQR